MRRQGTQKKSELQMGIEPMTFHTLVGSLLISIRLYLRDCVMQLIPINAFLTHICKLCDCAIQSVCHNPTYDLARHMSSRGSVALSPHNFILFKKDIASQLHMNISSIYIYLFES